MFLIERGGVLTVQMDVLGAKMVVVQVKRCGLVSKVSANPHKVVGCVSEVQCVRKLPNRGDKSLFYVLFGVFLVENAQSQHLKWSFWDEKVVGVNEKWHVIFRKSCASH